MEEIRLFALISECKRVQEYNKELLVLTGHS